MKNEILQETISEKRARLFLESSFSENSISIIIRSQKASIDNQIDLKQESDIIKEYSLN